MQSYSYGGDCLQLYSKFNKKHTTAIFLDRDGVIIKQKHLLHRIEDVEIIPEAVRALSQFNKLNIPIIIVSNQTVVARGLATVKEVININKLIYEKFFALKAYINAMLFCPHSPKADIYEYKKDCSWRKPHAGMLIKAHELFKIDLKKSILIGDTARDILTAKKVGMKSALVMTGHAGKDQLYKAEPDYYFKDILDASTHIINNKTI